VIGDGQMRAAISASMLLAQSVSTMSAQHLAYNISEACEVARAGRTTVYEAIRCGELRAVKRGRRTLVLAEDLRAWLARLPAIEVKPAGDNPPAMRR
jgi:excisionase family DNA binding protein